MSAYMVSNETINCLVNGIRIQDKIIMPDKHWQKLGKMFIKENQRSLAYRYPGTSKEMHNASPFVYSEKTYSEIEVIGCLFCYRYQASETKDFYKSEAWEYLSLYLYGVVQELEQFKNFPWGLDEEED